MRPSDFLSHIPNGIYWRNDHPNSTPMRNSGLLLNCIGAKLISMLEFCWPFTKGALPQKRPSEFQFRADLPGRLSGGKGQINVYVGIFRTFDRGLYRENDPGTFRSSRRRKANLMYLLEFFEHLPRGFIAKTTLWFQVYVELLGSFIKEHRAEMNVMLDFLDHLLRSFTAKTTFYVSARLKKFELFTEGLYRENDPRKILKHYTRVYRKNGPLTTKTHFGLPPKRPLKKRGPHNYLNGTVRKIPFYNVG